MCCFWWLSLSSVCLSSVLNVVRQAIMFSILIIITCVFLNLLSKLNVAAALSVSVFCSCHQKCNLNIV